MADAKQSGGRCRDCYLVDCRGRRVANQATLVRLVEGIDHFKNYGYVIVEPGTSKVKLTAKERTAENTYEATGETFEISLPQ